MKLAKRKKKVFLSKRSILIVPYIHVVPFRFGVQHYNLHSKSDRNMFKDYCLAIRHTKGILLLDALKNIF